MVSGNPVSVRRLEYRASEGLAEEMAASREQWTPEVQSSYLAQFPSSQAWLGEIRDSIDVQELLASVREFVPPASPVLDVGVGSGRSSLFMAELGHRVTAVEPAEEMCSILADACGRWGLKLDGIVCAPGEALGQLPAGEWDAVVFNASFHHVEDVPGTLADVHRLLRPDGVVLLVNEPVLPFFTSKSRWLRKIEENPEAMGHYGGNEHVYRNGEYLRFLREAGFQTSARLHVRNTNYPAVMRQLSGKRVNGAPVYSSRRLLVRAVAFGIISEMSSVAPIARALQRSSLVMSTFVGRKPD